MLSNFSVTRGRRPPPAATALPGHPALPHSDLALNLLQIPSRSPRTTARYA